MSEVDVSERLSADDLRYRRRKNAREMRFQVISFLLMITLTIIAFASIAFEKISMTQVLPFILLLAVIQVVFQLYYLMHLKEKSYKLAQFFLFSGVFFLLLIVVGFLTLIWI